MVIGLVRPRDHVASSAQRFVGKYTDALHTDRPKRAGVGAKPLPDLRRLSLSCARQLCRTQLMIAAQQHQQRLTFHHHNQAFDLRGCRQSRQCCDLRDGFNARRVKLLGSEIAFRIGNSRRLWHTDRLPEQCNVVPSPAHEHFAAGFRLGHELIAGADRLYSAPFQRETSITLSAHNRRNFVQRPLPQK